MTSYKFSNNFQDEIDGTITLDQNAFTCYCVDKLYWDGYLNKKAAFSDYPSDKRDAHIFEICGCNTCTNPDALVRAINPSAVTAHSTKPAWVYSINAQDDEKATPLVKDLAKFCESGEKQTFNEITITDSLSLKVFDLFAFHYDVLALLFPSTFSLDCCSGGQFCRQNAIVQSSDPDHAHVHLGTCTNKTVRPSDYEKFFLAECIANGKIPHDQLQGVLESVKANKGWLTYSDQKKDFELTDETRKQNIKNCVTSGKIFNYYAEMQRYKDDDIVNKLEMYLKTESGGSLDGYLNDVAPVTGSGTPCAKNCRDLDSLRIEAYCEGVYGEDTDGEFMANLADEDVHEDMHIGVVIGSSIAGVVAAGAFIALMIFI
jgi:hypothetical protein